MKKYVLLAGVNGAGKSTLFSLLPSLSEIIVMKAGKTVIKRINEYFEKDISFSQETTLCGKSIFQNVQKAKERGYSIEMHYVGLDSAVLAKERVKNRVERGGHGIWS